ncbi:HET-domain-containing protein [Alternaria alternata]|nr:HET-domain-containing protein [Alternaria alternata]
MAHIFLGGSGPALRENGQHRQGTLQLVTRLVMTDILAWKPPSWWAPDDITETPSKTDLRTFALGLLHGDRCRRIKSAYAKAKRCKVCCNNAWPTASGGIFIYSLLSSADKGCAGCLTLCGILNRCALLSKNSSKPFELSLDQWVSCRVERSRLVLECYPSASWEVFAPGSEYLKDVTSTAD